MQHQGINLKNKDDLHVLLFQVAEIWMGFPVQCVREVFHKASLILSPKTPSFLEGFLNLGGTAIPVLNLARLFDLPEKQDHLYTPFIITQTGSSIMGFQVEAVSGIVAICRQHLLSVGEQKAFNDCVEYLAELDEKRIHLLSMDKILIEQETRAVAQFRQMAQERVSRISMTA